MVTDTLSLGERTADNMERHASQARPRNQLLVDASGLKPKVEPTFDYSQNTNVTALVGKTAYLTCRVRNLGDKTVRLVRSALPRGPLGWSSVSVNNPFETREAEVADVAREIT